MSRSRRLLSLPAAVCFFFFFFSSRRRHTRSDRDWSSDVCSSDLYFGTTRGAGVDPLACDYAALFPAWQNRARTIAARGERLPFADHAFDVVLCDKDRKSVV